MGRMGQRFRLAGQAKCTLHLDGMAYHGEIENISLSGALVRLDSGIPDGMLPGCACDLRLNGRQEESYVGYTCRVVRLALACVGVQILELNYGETTH